jgi:hypothetical protein
LGRQVLYGFDVEERARFTAGADIRDDEPKRFEKRSSAGWLFGQAKLQLGLVQGLQP